MRFAPGISAIITICLGVSWILICPDLVVAGTLEDAKAAFRKSHYATALRLYLPLAEQGNLEAQTGLAFLYYLAAWRIDVIIEQGLPSGPGAIQDAESWRGVAPEYTEAANWYRRAAEQGHAHSQYMLGNLYRDGKGLAQNHVEAAKWYSRAAEQGQVDAQHDLGVAYFAGLGVPRNDVKAYMWLSLATAKTNVYAKDRDTVAKYMMPEEMAEAQKLAADWRPKTANAAQQEPTKGPLPSRKTEPAATSGTAFFVSNKGEALTNAHVVDDCRQISVNGGTARLVARDGTNDLALLATDQHPVQWASWRVSVRQGEDVVAYGFPLSGILSSGGNVVTGNVTALAGLGDDSRFLQISAPVQPGNSGGPLFDRYGNVIGVVVAKLNALKIASATGDIPQNVNFAIKASVATAFLYAQRISTHDPYAGVATAADPLSTPDVAARAQALAVQVLCVR